MATIASPGTRQENVNQQAPFYNVVLLDDDDHTYDYVIEMLGKIFMMPPEIAFHHAVEVDTAGRTVVMTCEKPHAEICRDRIEGCGPDPRLPKSKGSMIAIVEAA